MLTGLSGSVLLFLFYSSVRVKWPNSYITLRNQAEEAVARGPLRYAIFRAGPFLLVGLAVSASSERLKIDGSVALGALLLSHLAATNGRSFINSVKAGRVAANGILSNLATAFGLSALAYLILRYGERLSFLVPGLDEFVSALWTGLVAAVLAVLLQNFVRSDSDEVDLERLSRDIGPRLESYIDSCAWAHRLDPVLLRSILYAEVLNRPRWFRGIERAVGAFRSGGTYGIGQAGVTASASNESSIEAVAANYANVKVLRSRGAYGSLNAAALEALLERQNPSREFVKMAASIFSRLENRRAAFSSRRGIDDQAVVIVDRGLRVGAKWRIEGSCDQLVAGRLAIIGQVGAPAELTIQAAVLNGRRKWVALISLEEERVGFTVDSEPDFESGGTASPWLNAFMQAD